nr:hypothetical protein [Bacillus velezensis]
MPWTQKTSAWSAPESGSPRSFDEPQRFHGAARCRCSPDRPVNAGRFAFRRSPAGAVLGPSDADLLQLQPGRSVLARTQKAGAWSAPESGSPRSFDEPQRFHGAARYRCSPDRPVNAGRFLLQMLFLPVPIRTTAWGSPSVAARAFRPGQNTKSRRLIGSGIRQPPQLR